MSWYEAVEFCNCLTAHTQRPYRLPSEAEWEYACRAGTTTPFHFGRTLAPQAANYDGNYTYADGSKGEYREETTPVDKFDIANAFGLCDMHGNVDEWCQDHYGSYDQTPTNSSAWTTSDSEARRVLRGGSWSDYSGFCRSAYRVDSSPNFRYGYFGLRVSCLAPRT